MPLGVLSQDDIEDDEEDATERFIHRQNIEHYKRLLETVTDEAERMRILKLLEDEIQKTHLDGAPPEKKRRRA